MRRSDDSSAVIYILVAFAEKRILITVTKPKSTSAVFYFTSKAMKSKSIFKVGFQNWL